MRQMTRALIRNPNLFPRFRLSFLTTSFKLTTGIVLLGLVIGSAALAPWIVPFDPNAQNILQTLTPPQWFGGPHILGTDQLGRDVLSRVIYGSRISILIGLSVIFISGVIGITLGVASGFYSGSTDWMIQKFVEFIWAFPPLLIAICIVAFFGQRLDIIILSLVIQRWIPFCRISRAEALSLREREYVLAARSLGASGPRIMSRHILPNLLASCFVIGSFAMAGAVLAEASLSFLGLGVPPVIPSWGGMLAEAQSYITSAWWLASFPGLAIFITVLGLNVIGDGLRDVSDPTLRGTRV